MKVNAMKDKTVTELNQQLIDLRREQFNLNMQKGVSETIRPHLYKKVRRDIARVKTMIKQKETLS